MLISPGKLPGKAPFTLSKAIPGHGTRKIDLRLESKP
jgi:hypothetical protein